jgi:putative nucleotidyltransferase with HDIG domain
LEMKIETSRKAKQDDGTGEARATPSGVARILIVDDELATRRLLTVMLGEAGLPCKAAGCAEEGLMALETEPVDAVLSDLQMPGTSGMAFLAEVRRRYRHLVFLMMTGVDDIRVGIEAMKKGADDYLVKPLQIEIVMASLERALEKKRLEKEVENYRLRLEEMVKERTGQLEAALWRVERGYEDTLEALGAAIDLRDSETSGHSQRVTLYSTKIAKELGVAEHELKTIAMGAWLHDIGKLAIPDTILLKPGALTEEEWIIMRSHSQLGFDLVKRIAFLSDAAEIVLTHHERCDGSGYPRGLKTADIPAGARIFAVADTVDAMTSDRPYRLALSFEEARDEIRRGSGSRYDPRVADVFLSVAIQNWKEIRRSLQIPGSGFERMERNQARRPNCDS